MKNNKEIIILFDLDGTLIDSTEAIVGCFYHSFEELNFNFKGNTEDITREIGYPLDKMYQKIGVPKEIVWDFVDSYKNQYKKVSESQTILLENAYEAVKLASSFARLGVVTTKTTQYSIPLLENFGIMDYFETIIGRQEVVNPKPHPEPIENAIKNLNVTKNEHIYMIGDTKLDLIAANEAGVKGVGVLSGYGTKKELSIYTNEIYNNALEAIEQIRNIHFS